MNINDVFKEQLVSRKTNSKDTMKKIGMILLGVVIIALISLVFPAFSIVSVIFVGWIEFVLIRRFNLEFEYIFTNGELDIDKIYNKLKRKHALTIDVRSFVVMTKMNNPALKSEIGNINQVVDYSTGEITDSTYAAVYEQEGKRIQLIFEPNETLFNAIRAYIPKKIK